MGCEVVGQLGWGEVGWELEGEVVWDLLSLVAPPCHKCHLLVCIKESMEATSCSDASDH